MANVIKPKRTTVAGRVPTTANIAVGEIALNMADSILYFRDTSDNIKSVSSGLATVGTAGTYTKVTTDAFGRVTAGTTLSSGDIPTLNQNTTGSSGSCSGNAATATNVDWSGVTSKPTTVSGYGITDANTKYVSNVTVPNTSTYQQVCRVNGSGLGSCVRITLVGTSGNVVVDIIADIIVNHHQDITLKSMSGAYTQLYIQVVSDGNDSFDIRLRGTDSISNTVLSMEVHTLNSESVTFTTSASYSSSTLTHLTKASSVHLSASGGDTANFFANDNVLLNSANYNSYAPTLTGAGASGTWGINVTGNAATATKLATARTINGVSFDGTANITITASESTTITEW